MSDKYVKVPAPEGNESSYVKTLREQSGHTQAGQARESARQIEQEKNAVAHLAQSTASLLKRAETSEAYAADLRQRLALAEAKLLENSIQWEEGRGYVFNGKD